MPILNYRGCYIHHTPEFYHEICKVYSDKELTNEIYDFVMLDVHGNCPYPVNIDKAIMNRIDKWLEKQLQAKKKNSLYQLNKSIMRSKLNIKFDNYETTSSMIAKLQMQCEDILKDIVEEIINIYKIPYISFNDESGYVNFFDESIGETSSIIGIKVVELNGEKTLQIANSDYNVENLTDDEVWFNPNLYGDFSRNEMVSMLISMFKGE